MKKLQNISRITKIYAYGTVWDCKQFCRLQRILLSHMVYDAFQAGFQGIMKYFESNDSKS